MALTFKEQFMQEDVSVQPESNDLKNLAVLMHAFTFIGFPVIGPIVLWLIKKDESRFIDVQFRELMNFHLSHFVAVLIAAALSFVCIGIPILFALLIVSFALPIVAMIKASQGKVYRFPFVYRVF